MSFNSTTPGALHPYYPLGVEIAGYMVNEWNTVELVSMFAAGCVAIFTTTYAIAIRLRPNTSTSDLATIMWFTLCGCIHLFFEGYFAYNFRRMGGMQDLFGQLWKEYSLSDSRYLTQDAFVLCMESITAVGFPCPPRPRPTANGRRSDLLGASLVCHCRPHRSRPPAALLAPAHCLARPVLRRRAILCNILVRPLHP